MRAATAALIVLFSVSARAQVVRGEVREATTHRSVAGVSIVFRDSSAIVAGYLRTDESGKFEMRVPVAGFALRATRIGFAPESLSTFGAEPFDTLEVVIEMHALPALLAKVVIAEEKRQIRDTRVMGLDLRTMSTDLITPTQLAATSLGAHTYLDAIQSLLPAGVMVSQRSQCVVMNRGTRITGAQNCSMVFVDGVRIDLADAVIDLVQPQWLDHAIFVRAADAGIRFGTGAAGGVLLLFTKHGSYALDARP